MMRATQNNVLVGLFLRRTDEDVEKESPYATAWGGC